MAAKMTIANSKKTNILKHTTMRTAGTSRPTKTASANTTSDLEDGQVDRRNVFRFMDLPPELRNQIYHYLLEACDEIRISGYQNKVKKALPQWGRPDGKIGHTLKGIVIGTQNGKKRKLYVGEIHPLAILLVNKAIKAEAISVFYGANTFNFDGASALSEFKERAGSNFSLLKNIHVKNVSYTGQSEHLGLSLCCLKAPTSIALDGLTGGRHSSITLEAQSLGETLGCFMKSRFEWSQDGFYGVKGRYKTELSLDDVEQEQRFDTISFAVKPGAKLTLGKGEVAVAEEELGFHAIIKDAVVEYWEEKRKTAMYRAGLRKKG